MNKANGPAGQVKIGLGIALLAVLTGCVDYMGGGYGGPVMVPGPDMYFFGGYGGYYERGRDVRHYSHRGFESRALAHPVGGGQGRHDDSHRGSEGRAPSRPVSGGKGGKR